jgi:hypothetical protein
MAATSKDSVETGLVFQSLWEDWGWLDSAFAHGDSFKASYPTGDPFQLDKTRSRPFSAGDASSSEDSRSFTTTDFLEGYPHSSALMYPLTSLIPDENSCLSFPPPSFPFEMEEAFSESLPERERASADTGVRTTDEAKSVTLMQVFGEGIEPLSPTPSPHHRSFSSLEMALTQIPSQGLTDVSKKKAQRKRNESTQFLCPVSGPHFSVIIALYLSPVNDSLSQ